MLEFEWDEGKRLSNLEKHKIDFAEAREVFDGRDTIQARLAYEREVRYATTGLLKGSFVTIVWTRRGENIRLISVRGARDEERRKYRQLYGGGTR